MGHSVHNLLTPSVHNLMTLTVHEVLTLYTNYADRIVTTLLPNNRSQQNSPPPLSGRRVWPTLTRCKCANRSGVLVARFTSAI